MQKKSRKALRKGKKAFRKAVKGAGPVALGVTAVGALTAVAALNPSVKQRSAALWKSVSGRLLRTGRKARGFLQNGVHESNESSRDLADVPNGVS